MPDATAIPALAISPTPWGSIVEGADAEDCLITVTDRSGYGIADVGGRTQMQAYANADLMKASPKLYAALSTAAHIVHDGGSAISPSLHNDAFEACNNSVCTRHRDVLAEARGETGGAG